ncbi:hypothetical protein FI667_g11155, partial [Globisporangium splendens]
MGDELPVDAELPDHVSTSASSHGARDMLNGSSNSMTSSLDNTREVPRKTVLRKSHSATSDYCSVDSTVVTPDQDGEYDTDHDGGVNRRPFTAATSSPSKFHGMTATAKKKKLPAKKPSLASMESRSNDRPHSADLNGWGDFDTDRLLQEDFEGSTNLVDEENEDALVLALQAGTTLDESHRERMRPKSRNRHSAPATSTQNAIDDFPYVLQATESARYKLSKEQQRPATHVLRQRPLVVVDFDSTQAAKSEAKRVSRSNIIQSQSRPPTGGGPLPTPATQQNRLARLQQGPTCIPLPLFGSSLPDSFEMRATIFERFQYLWSLMSTRSSSACDAAGSVSDGAHAKPPFECSMALIKICKTVGIH